MKTDLFQSCGHCWVFQICWHIECSTFTAYSFRIWNSSTGIPSPPLALFIVMFSQARLTSHSRMSGCRWVWVITSSWLSGSWRYFLYSSPVYSCHLFLISSASVTWKNKYIERKNNFVSFFNSQNHYWDMCSWWHCITSQILELDWPPFFHSLPHFSFLAILVSWKPLKTQSCKYMGSSRRI